MNSVGGNDGPERPVGEVVSVGARVRSRFIYGVIGLLAWSLGWGFLGIMLILSDDTPTRVVGVFATIVGLASFGMCITGVYQRRLWPGCVLDPARQTCVIIGDGRTVVVAFDQISSCVICWREVHTKRGSAIRETLTLTVDSVRYEVSVPGLLGHAGDDLRHIRSALPNLPVHREPWPTEVSES